VSRDTHIDPALHRQRRQRLLNALGDGVLLLRTARETPRNGDVLHEYRPGSDLHFLTGFGEPDAVLVARRIDRRRHHAVLFVRERDAEREIWDGKRFGVAGARKAFGVDDACAIGDLWKLLPELVPADGRLFHTMGVDRAFDERLFRTFAAARQRVRRRLCPLHPTIEDPLPALSRLRQVKDAVELRALREAARVTVAGHVQAMRATRPGMFEYQAQAELEATFRRLGSPRNGYPSIVASGPNACVLHYHENDRKMRRGDLLLIDAGAEVGGVTADVTRTFPVGGTFDDAQAAVYGVVLRAQLAGIRACKVGAPWDAAHKACVRALTKGLVELGVLRGDLRRLVKEGAFRPFYMHGTSHWLGRDVHDVGGYEDHNGRALPLPAGAVLTVEPGLYFGTRDRAIPKELRGIGVRIEDDVHVTRRGPVVLTDAAPKRIADIERLMAPDA